MIIALSGGVGGARFAEGLAQIFGKDVTIIVNTADDFEHVGLPISPDIDTVLYTLAGLENPGRGWGLRDESWSFMKQLAKLGAPDWFQLGDRDVAMHLLRREWFSAGRNLTEITGEFATRLGVSARILPMCNEPVSTIVHSVDGDLAFQEYFVRLRCEVAVKGFSFAGAEKSQPTSEIKAALADGNLEAILLGPSNPFVSIAPILAVPGLRELIADARVPLVAVSPIIGGAAVKGPAAKMMKELGLPASALAIARHYADLIDGIVIDRADEGAVPEIEALGIMPHVTDALMRDGPGRRRLAEETLTLARRLRDGRGLDRRPQGPR